MPEDHERSPRHNPLFDHYDNLATALLANSRATNRLMHQLQGELTSGMSNQDIIDTAMQGHKAIGKENWHPSDKLSSEQKTPDVMAMFNTFSRLESLVTGREFSESDLFELGDYAATYAEYRLKVLEANLLQAKEGRSEKQQSTVEKYQQLGNKLGKIQYGYPERTHIKEACTTLLESYVRLIEGQAEARLKKQGKDLDPLLYDPTIQRLTEADIRNAGYQYKLITEGLLPQRPNPSLN